MKKEKIQFIEVDSEWFSKLMQIMLMIHIKGRPFKGLPDKRPDYIEIKSGIRVVKKTEKQTFSCNIRSH